MCFCSYELVVDPCEDDPLPSTSSTDIDNDSRICVSLTDSFGGGETTSVQEEETAETGRHTKHYSDPNSAGSSGDVTPAEREQTGKRRSHVEHDSASSSAVRGHETTTAGGERLSKRRRQTEHDSASASAIKSASTVMNSIYERMQQKSQKTESNATRAFCDLMYQQLMSIEDDESREMLQFELHSVIMRFKFQRNASSPFVNLSGSSGSSVHSGPDDVSFSSLLQSDLYFNM